MHIQQVVVSHDGTKKHLNNISTVIPKGKVTTILGPNGSGKSTLLSVMARNNKPLQGFVQLEQKDIMEYKPKQFAKKLAIVYQQNDIPEDLTVEKLVSFGRMPYNSLFKKETTDDEQAIEWALEATNLLHKRTSDLTALSGGERQRVWIAMALAQKSEILCLDEPTTYLDVYYQIELLQLVRQLNERYGLTIVMVLHDINQAMQFSDHILVMKDGELVAEGEPKAIITPQLMLDVYNVHVIFREDDIAGYTMMMVGI